MDIPVLLEPTPTGVRATTGAPLNLVAEGPTFDIAVHSLKQQIVAMQDSGKLVTVRVGDPDPLIARLALLASEPFMDEWAKGIQEYRAEVNTPPENDEPPPSTPPLNGTGQSVPSSTPATGLLNCPLSKGRMP